MRLRLLDLDGSLPDQAAFRPLIAQARAQVIDLRAGERAYRLWATRYAMARLTHWLERAASPPGDDPLVTFYGSGDYHHLTTAFLRAVTRPVTVLHFDNHPDWCRYPPTHNCGGWVSRALNLRHVARVITLGPCSNDLVRPQLQGGNLAALEAGRLELYPWRHAPSRVWGHVGDGPDRRQVGGHLVWRELADAPWDGFWQDLLHRLPTRDVWITIDKDVLAPQDAATNWDQGEMPLERLLDAVRKIAEACRVVGIDICGEYSPPRFGNPAKWLAARLDRADMPPPAADVLPRNEHTNAALLNTLMKVLP